MDSQSNDDAETSFLAIERCIREIREVRDQQRDIVNGVRRELATAERTISSTADSVSSHTKRIKEDAQIIVDLQELHNNSHDTFVSMINAYYRLLQQEIQSTDRGDIYEKSRRIASHVQEMESELTQKSVELDNHRIDQLITKIETVLTDNIDELFNKLKPGQLAEPAIFLSLSWNSGEDLLFATSVYPRAVLVNDKVYIAGGVTSSDKAAIVMCYDIKHKFWIELPPYISYYDQYCYSALAVLNDEVLMIGGQGCNHNSTDRTNKVCTWDESSRKWIERYHPMITPCDSPTVVTYLNRWLIVIGGRPGRLTDVQILDSRSSRWYSGAPLPYGCFDASAVTVNDTCYVIGGSTDNSSRRVFFVDLDNLINIASCPWQTLPDTPLERSTALAYRGALLAVGGRSGSSDIFFYQHSKKQWVKAGELPRARYDCSCILLSAHNQIFVAGGGGDNSKKVDISCTIL